MSLIRSAENGTVAVNGVLLHYSVIGEGKPVVLVHGNGESRHIFDHWVGRLAGEGYRVYAPDSRGQGENEPLSEYHYADMAEDIYRFIAALGLRKPLYYGYSDGGIIGLLLALSHPDVLSGMAISGTNLTPEGIDPVCLEEMRAENERCRQPLLTMMLNEPAIDERRLREIDLPVLVTAGEFDLILREETNRIAANLPRAKKVIVPGADHGSYICTGDGICDLLIDFYARLAE